MREDISEGHDFLPFYLWSHLLNFVRQITGGFTYYLQITHNRIYRLSVCREFMEFHVADVLEN